MNMDTIKNFALSHIEKENLKNAKLLELDFSKEQSTDSVSVYLGEVEFTEDDDEEGSSVFEVTVLKSGHMEFEWN
jgi:hypothetical protein